MFTVNVGLALIILSTATILAQEKSRISPAHEMEARKLIRSQISPEYLEEMYTEASRVSALHYQAHIQAVLKRELSEHEKQRLLLFWYRKIKELMPYTNLENMILPIVTKHLTHAETKEINRFYETPVGKKLTSVIAIMTREGQGAGEEIARKIADKKWLGSMTQELKVEFPYWFPAPEQSR